MKHAHAQSAANRSPLTLLGTVLALLTMLAMGTGMLGYGHQQIQHDQDCAAGLVCPDSESDETASDHPGEPEPAHDCELCDLIQGSQAKLLMPLGPAGLIAPDTGQRLTIENMRVIARDGDRAHFARPPPPAQF